MSMFAGKLAGGLMQSSAYPLEIVKTIGYEPWGGGGNTAVLPFLAQPLVLTTKADQPRSPNWPGASVRSAWCSVSNSREEDGVYRVYDLTGDPDKSRRSGRETIAWIREAQDRGIGEIVLNCMNRDGVRQGYDCRQLESVHRYSNVPLIASGGAGAEEHFLDVFHNASVDGALAASVFHSGEIDIHELKQYLAANQIEVRL